MSAFNEPCCECNQTIPGASYRTEPYHQCDGCGRRICGSCYPSIEMVHVTRPTQINRSGFVKLCRSCRKIYSDSTKIEEHPYLG